MATAAGFSAVCVVPTPMAVRFIGEVAQVEAATGFPVRSDYRRPEETEALPAADAFLVSPLTFNSLNKWSAGISDTLAMGLINEGLGSGVPITAVPWVNAPLAQHPAAAASIATLRGAGVRFTGGFGHPSTRIPGPDGRTGVPIYPWDEVEAAISRMAAECGAV
jgi:phosphopantothenoylcysteine synthetase/decarboxylase